MPSSGPADMERSIERWAAQVHAKAETYKTLTSEMSKITGRSEAANGAIRVTVNQAGLVTDLSLSDDVRSMRGSRLSAEIMTAIRRAQAALGDQVVDLMKQRVGDDAETIATIASSYAQQFPSPDPQQNNDKSAHRATLEGEELSDPYFDHQNQQRWR